MKQISTIFILISIFISSLSAQVIYVDASATGNADGTDWPNAYTSLQSALSEATQGDSIWVTANTYLPTESNDRGIYFELKDGVKLLGGFAGNEVSISERDWQANPTILSGDIGIAGDSTDNSFTVLYMQGVGPATFVDGFTFVGGVADDIGGICSPGTCGAAIYIDGEDAEAHPRIWNCQFEGNYAKVGGGAVYVNGHGDGSVAPQFFNCGFYANSAGRRGGAIERDGGSWTGTANDFWDCVFENNTAGQHGGAVFYLESEGADTIEFTRCSFFGNEAGLHGGGITYFNGRTTGSMVAIKNCLFEKNIASAVGAISFIDFNFQLITSVLITGSRFTQNNGIQIIVMEDTDHPALVTIDSSEFVLNEDGFQGMLLVEGSRFGTVNINNLKFIGNNTRGLCRFSLFNEVNVRNSLFIGNRENEVVVGSSILEITQTFQAKCMNSLFLDNLISSNSLWYRNNADVLESGTDTIVGCVVKNCLFQSPFIINGNNVNLYLSNSIIIEDSTHQNFQTFGVDTLFVENSFITAADCPVLPSSEDFAEVICGEGNLFGLDPLFVDTASGDYHLLPCSPARNAGDNGIVNLLGVATDLDGQPRIQEGQVDMGAYEMPTYSVFSDTVVHAACNGGMGGFTASITSGCGPFTVEYNGESTAENEAVFTVNGLSAGTHLIVVKDAGGREDTLEIIISEPPLIEVEVAATAVDCTDGMSGTATASASGGTGSLSYEWSNGMSGASVMGLPVGNHTVTVMDSLGCTATDSLEIEITGDLPLSVEATDESCFGFLDGTATAVPEGTAPFVWSWEGGQTDSLLTGLAPGNYQATVTDAFGCSGLLKAAVGGFDSLTVEVMGTDSLCHGTESGVLTSLVSGGAWPYTFDWGNGSEDSLLVGVGTGSYPLTVEDANGCTADAQATIEGLSVLGVSGIISHATGASNSDGSIDISAVMGGVPDYTFLWDTGDTTSSITGLLPGDYTVTVTDAEGCEGVFVFTVEIEVAVMEKIGTVASVGIYPSPVSRNGIAWLLTESRQPLLLNLQLSDVGGSRVWSAQVQVRGGMERHELEVPDISGMYFLRVKAEGTEQSVVLRLLAQ